ncbi:MAG: RluA family pseudouridine synthase [Puniceicoccales bacterium]|jgi:23S rRNA pseudouridine1911/1915/1917 synthase|nr:RluA family pseudouridine synthase [Puniceicoccales bacterium]
MDAEKSTFFHRTEISPALAGERADRILAICLPEFSRTELQKYFKAGRVFCEGSVVSAKERLPAGKFLEWNPPEPESAVANPSPELFSPDILFEDEDMLVISKPAGIVVHRGTGVHGITLLEALVARHMTLSALGGPDRAGIVHRLDKDTSGVMVLAKTDLAYQALQVAFASRKVQKIYHTLVRSVPSCLSGTVQVPVGRHPVRRTQQCVCPEGRSARSDWKVLETFGEHYAHLRVQIFTGRTHQIRVHLQYLGFPILGDSHYGYRLHASDPCRFDRVMLHAHQLTLPHPRSGEERCFRAPLAEDFVEKLKFLRTYFPPSTLFHESKDENPASSAER